MACAVVTQAAASGFGSEFEAHNERTLYRNPFAGIHKVAIVPFFAITEDIDAARFTKAFAGQLENYPDWEIIYPQMVALVAKSQNKMIVTPHDAISIGRELGADAVILGEIRDFDAYYPPKIVLKIALYRTNRDGSSRDVMNLMRQAIATDEMGLKRGAPIYTLSEGYDAGREHVMKLIKRYAVLFNQSKEAMKIDLFLRSQDRFFEAVSYTIRQDILLAQNKAHKMQI